MILPVALLQLAVPPPSLGAIGRQALPAHGCAAYLWSDGAGKLVAMATADPAQLRLSLDGAAPADLPRVARTGEAPLGFAATTVYRAGDVAATLDLTIAPRDDLKDGAMVPQATLRVDRTGRDELVMPLAGVIGCGAG